MASALNRNRQLALVSRAGACYAPGQDFSPFGHALAKARHVLIIHLVDFIYTEAAHLAAALAAAADRALLSFDFLSFFGQAINLL